MANAAYPILPPGLILAGGEARRMGGSAKAGLRLGSRSLLAHAVDRLAPQCGQLLLSLHTDTDPLPVDVAQGQFATIVTDASASRDGPLAGLVAAMAHLAQTAPDQRQIVTISVDCPFLPPDFVARLVARQQDTGASIVCARSNDQNHRLCALWRLDLLDDLRQAFHAEGIRKVGLFQTRHRLETVNWAHKPYDPCYNINTAGDLEAAQALAAPALEPVPALINLDLRGLKCPLPALQARKALAKLPPGAQLSMVCTDPMSAIDIPHLAQETGNRLELSERNGHELCFVIRKV